MKNEMHFPESMVNEMVANAIRQERERCASIAQGHLDSAENHSDNFGHGYRSASINIHSAIINDQENIPFDGRRIFKTPKGEPNLKPSHVYPAQK